MKSKKEQEEILAGFGVSLVEYEAMSCPYYGVPGNPREMASYTVLENNGCGPYENDCFCADEYLIAIEGMLAKGWLCLQMEETPHGHVKHSEIKIPQGREFPLPIGSVVFTKTGYLLHRRLLRALHGLRFMQQADSFAVVDEKNHEIHFYAASKALCEEWIHDLRQISLKLNVFAPLVNPPVDFVSSEGPRQIGKWKPSPYLTLPKGYHALVRYRRHRPRRFNMKKLQLGSKILNFQPVFISGKIAGKSFSFGDNPSWTCSCHGKMDDSCAEYHWDFTVDGPPGIETPPQAHLTGETYTGGYGTRNILFQLEEQNQNPRKRTLTLREAKRIVIDCARKYLDSVENKDKE